VDASVLVRSATVRANGLQFGVLEAGTGPLALCLHGFPDSAHTWRHLLPALAGAGFHAVAPFMRGYAPTAIPADGAYHLGAIGHDWGAETAYGAAAFAPDRWRRLVTLAVPPAALDEVLFNDYEQLKRFFYLFMFRDPAGFAETVVARDDMAFLDELWRDWSPGFQPGEHLAQVKQSLRQPANLAAALGYYRAAGGAGPAVQAAGTADRSAAEQQASGRQAPQPTLYLHGARDGCIGADLARGSERFLAPSSRMIVIEDAGHFLHLENPGQVNDHILSWVS
jgi:pimeloyl-ACP methyl ester carboxylesterase